MKRLLAVMLILVLVFPSSFAGAESIAANKYIGEYEVFDEGSFEVVNGANSSEKLLKKDTITKWIFKKENNNGFNMSNYPECFLQKGDEINKTAFLSTGETTMIDGKKSRVYRNFDRVYNQGVVRVKVLIRTRLKWRNSASVGFAADTQSEAYQLACDDVKVYYGDGNGPVAYDIKLSGYNIEGHDLIAEYKYFDVDYEKNTVIEWCSADDKYLTENVSVLKTENINSQTISRYRLSTADVGRYIGVCIKPVNNGAVKGHTSVAVFPETVREAVTKPTVTLITPYANTRIMQNYPVYLSAEAFCDNTNITKVEFYCDDVKIAECSNAPYNVKYADLASGTHSIYATAYNALGEAA